jgi:hypothetical protein
MKDQHPITIRELYPEMNEAQLAEAERNLRRYVQIIWRIYERLKAEGKQWPGLEANDADCADCADLTSGPTSFTIPDERSNSTNIINQ